MNDIIEIDLPSDDIDEDTTHGLVTDWIPGTPLHDQTEPILDEDTVYDIGVKLTDIPRFCHNNDLVLLGLEPSDIVLAENEQKPILVDCKCAVDISDHSESTFIGESEIPFAPEVKDGTIIADAAADTYALGTILHKLLVGFCPKSRE